MEYGLERAVGYMDQVLRETGPEGQENEERKKEEY